MGRLIRDPQLQRRPSMGMGAVFAPSRPSSTGGGMDTDSDVIMLDNDNGVAYDYEGYEGGGEEGYASVRQTLQASYDAPSATTTVHHEHRRRLFEAPPPLVESPIELSSAPESEYDLFEALNRHIEALDEQIETSSSIRNVWEQQEEAEFYEWDFESHEEQQQHEYQQSGVGGGEQQYQQSVYEQQHQQQQYQHSVGYQQQMYQEEGFGMFQSYNQMETQSSSATTKFEETTQTLAAFVPPRATPWGQQNGFTWPQPSTMYQAHQSATSYSSASQSATPYEESPQATASIFEQPETAASYEETSQQRTTTATFVQPEAPQTSFGQPVSSTRYEAPKATAALFAQPQPATSFAAPQKAKSFGQDLTSTRYEAPKPEQPKAKDAIQKRKGPPPLPESDDPYELLGLDHENPPDDDSDEIRRAYVKMAKIYHPDAIDAKTPEEKEVASMNFARINNAYRMLKDEKTKLQSDYFATTMGGPMYEPRGSSRHIRRPFSHGYDFEESSMFSRSYSATYGNKKGEGYNRPQQEPYGEHRSPFRAARMQVDNCHTGNDNRKPFSYGNA